MEVGDPLLEDDALLHLLLRGAVVPSHPQLGELCRIGGRTAVGVGVGFRKSGADKVFVDARNTPLFEREADALLVDGLSAATHVPAEHADGFRLQEGHLGGIHPLQRSSHAVYEVDA